MVFGKDCNEQACSCLQAARSRMNARQHYAQHVPKGLCCVRLSAGSCQPEPWPGPPSTKQAHMQKPQSCMTAPPGPRPHAHDCNRHCSTRKKLWHPSVLNHTDVAHETGRNSKMWRCTCTQGKVPLSCSLVRLVAAWQWRGRHAFTPLRCVHASAAPAAGV